MRGATVRSADLTSRGLPSRLPPLGVRRKQLTDRVGITERPHKALRQNLRDAHLTVIGRAETPRQISSWL